MTEQRYMLLNFKFASFAEVWLHPSISPKSFNFYKKIFLYDKLTMYQALCYVLYMYSFFVNIFIGV